MLMLSIFGTIRLFYHHVIRRKEKIIFLNDKVAM